jgi:hypothetical protein
LRKRAHFALGAAASRDGSRSVLKAHAHSSNIAAILCSDDQPQSTIINIGN